MQRFRGGLVFKAHSIDFVYHSAHKLCVSLKSRLESNKEEKIRLGIMGEGPELPKPSDVRRACPVQVLANPNPQTLNPTP